VLLFMFPFPDLAVRDRQPELMDQPDLARALHHGALRGLQRINGISFSVRVLWAEIQRAGLTRQNRPLRILDVACGGGDVAIGLCRQAARHSVAVEITGVDVSPVAVEYARQQASDSGARVLFAERDIIADGLPDRFDVVCCSLFLHHLDESDAVSLLSAFRDAAKQRVLVSDLVRSRSGYALCWIGTRLLSRSPIVHADGLLSVRAAWSVPEARELASRAGMPDAQLRRQWPQRFLLTWSPS
jgi:2-polyprenyl-3-methyl-5-hydroxy-6-metoxy-1,4-benzoquinol methylase